MPRHLHLAALVDAFAAVEAALAALLAQEAAAHGGDAGAEAAAVLLLPGRRALLVSALGRVSLLVAHLGWGTAVALLWRVALLRVVGLLRVLRAAVVVSLVRHCD